MSRMRRPSRRAFAPTLGAALEARELMTARVAARPHAMTTPPVVVGLPPSAAPAGVAPPRVAMTQLIVRGKVVTGISLRFTQPMDPGPVSDVRSYALFDSGVRGRGLQAVSVPLRSASYNPASATVTLTPASRLKPSGTYVLTNVDVSNPLDTHADYFRAYARQAGFTSLAGVPLDGIGTGTGSFAETITRRPTPGHHVGA